MNNLGLDHEQLFYQNPGTLVGNLRSIGHGQTDLHVCGYRPAKKKTSYLLFVVYVAVQMIVMLHSLYMVKLTYRCVSLCRFMILFYSFPSGLYVHKKR